MSIFNDAYNATESLRVVKGLGEIFQKELGEQNGMLYAVSKNFVPTEDV